MYSSDSNDPSRSNHPCNYATNCRTRRHFSRSKYPVTFTDVAKIWRRNLPKLMDSIVVLVMVMSLFNLSAPPSAAIADTISISAAPTTAQGLSQMDSSGIADLPVPSPESSGTQAQNDIRYAQQPGVSNSPASASDQGPSSYIFANAVDISSATSYPSISPSPESSPISTAATSTSTSSATYPPSSTTPPTASTTAPPTVTALTSTPVTPPPTYTIQLPSPIATLTPIPDDSYVQHSLDQERAALLAQIAALPLLTGTVSGTLVSGLTGGRIVSADGGLTIGMMPGVVTSTSTINVQVNRTTFPQGDPRATRNGQPLAYTYQLTATEALSGQRITRFNKDVNLVWSIDPAVLAAANVHGFPLRVYTYNEASGQWDEVPSTWNADTHQLIASTPHFSIYAIADSSDPLQNYLPSVSDFEVNLQSGTAGIGYPLNLPPGPAGFGPKVMLSYNSGNIDRVDVSQQGPSELGWGWSLSTNYIAATEHHFSGGAYNPWTASIVADGTTGDLIKGSDGYWHTAMESFARVQYFQGGGSNPRTHDHWEAWGKDGTHYVFDQNAVTPDGYPQHEGHTTYKWMLHTATDVNGNTLTYTYAYQNGNNDLVYNPPGVDDGDKATAVYPYQILYGSSGDKIQVTFDIVQRTISGTIDLGPNYADNNVYQMYRIDRVDVQRKQAIDNSYALLRSYQFDQDYTIVLTDSTNTARPHLTLLGVTQKAPNPQQPQQLQQLPGMTFLYISPSVCPANGSGWPNPPTPYDIGHLCYAYNGYGGSTAFYYDAAGNGLNAAYRRVRAKRLRDGFGPNAPGSESNPHDSLYSYDYHGAEINSTNISDESNTYNGHKPLHDVGKEFRGFAWVRETDPIGQVIDHYYNRDDILKSREWRTQMGKANAFTDPMDSTPVSNGNWTITGPVVGTTDPSPGVNNNVWKLSQGGTIARTSGVPDGFDVNMRLMMQTVNAPDPEASRHFAGSWKLTNTNGDGEYFGVQFQRMYVLGHQSYEVQPTIVWAVLVGNQLVTGSRDLSELSPLLPRRDRELYFNQWYRVRLHTSPDGRFAVELYRDDDKDYIVIKSGDTADNGNPIPRLPVKQSWAFQNTVTDDNSGYYAALADDYSETFTLYSQSDTVYSDRTPVGAEAAQINEAHALVGQGNNCDAMYIRFWPTTESWSAIYDEGKHSTSNIRGKQTYDYDAYGNQSLMTEYGNLDTAGDERFTVSSFAVLSATNILTPYIVSKIGHTLTYSSTTGTYLLAETHYFYDNDINYGEILPGGKGLLTEVKKVGVRDGQRNDGVSVQQMHYDGYGNTDQVTDPDNHTTTTSFDTYYHSFPTTLTYPNERSQIKSYDYRYDAVVSVTDENNVVTNYANDAFGRHVNTWIGTTPGIDPPDEVYSYTDVDQSAMTPPIRLSYQHLISRNGNSNQYGWQTRWFDGRGRTIEDLTPKDTSNSQIVVADNTYTVTGVLSSTSMPYLATGGITSYVEPDLSKPRTTYKYDLAGRPSMSTNTDNTQIIYDYSQLMWVGTRDEDGHQQWHHTDMLGRTDLAWDQDNPIGNLFPHDMYVNYSYDLLDRLVEIDRQVGGGSVVSSTIKYDGLGRKSLMADPDTGTWEYAYDAVGNMTMQRDALCSSISCKDPTHQLFYSYDSMNRMTAKFYGSSNYINNIPDVKYYYDSALGPGDGDASHSWNRLRAVEVTAQGIQGQAGKANMHKYVYDYEGRMTTDVLTTTALTTRPYTTTYSYDAGSRLTSMIYPNPGTPEQVNVSYNTQGMGLPNQLSSSVPNNPYPVYSATYNEKGQLLSMGQGSMLSTNYLTTTLTYDDATTKRGRLLNTNVTSLDANNNTSTLLNLSYTYTNNSDIQQISNQNISKPSTTNPTFTNTYGYDFFDRLASASSTASTSSGSLFPSESYSFDLISRMTSRVISNTTYSYAYGDTLHADAPTSYKGNSYSYDAAGNQTKGVVNGVAQSRSYDQENRLSEVVSGTTTLDFVYDGNGQRLVQSVTAQNGKLSTQTSTLYISGLYEEVLSDANHPYTNYYALGSKMVGLRKANYSDPSSNGQFRIVGDQLGSTTLLVDCSTPPNVVNRQYYKPYGEVAFSTGNSGGLTSKGYTGQRLDADSGLMYYGARYYDPALAYFLSTDPMVAQPYEPKSLNRYSYVQNNPIINTDPTGMCQFKHNAQGGEYFADPQNLDCTVDDFDHMTSQQRLEWVDAFQSYYHLGNVFNGVKGAIMYFDWSSQHSGIDFTPGNSYMSRADAYTLLSMQDGMRVYQGGSAIHFDPYDLGSTNGPQAWARFYTAYCGGSSGCKGGENFYASGVAEKWGDAEQKSVDYAMHKTDVERGGRPTGLQGYLIDWAFGSTNYFRGKMAANGVHFWDMGSAWDPTADPKRQLYAGIATEMAARTAWNLLDDNGRAEWNNPHHNDWFWGFMFAYEADTQIPQPLDVTRWLP